VLGRAVLEQFLCNFTKKPWVVSSPHIKKRKLLSGPAK
jgi:hypothetical protein